MNPAPPVTTTVWCESFTARLFSRTKAGVDEHPRRCGLASRKERRLEPRERVPHVEGEIERPGERALAVLLAVIDGGVLPPIFLERAQLDRGEERRVHRLTERVIGVA